MVGEPQVTLQEFDGIMGQVKVRYTVAITESDNTRTLVDTEDNFTMKWNEKRIYMMNYERNANEMFTGKREAFSGKRIILGITNDNMVKTVKCPKSRYLAFKTGGTCGVMTRLTMNWCAFLHLTAARMMESEAGMTGMM